MARKTTKARDVELANLRAHLEQRKTTIERLQHDSDLLAGLRREYAEAVALLGGRTGDELIRVTKDRMAELHDAVAVKNQWQSEVARSRSATLDLAAFRAHHQRVDEALGTPGSVPEEQLARVATLMQHSRDLQFIAEAYGVEPTSQAIAAAALNQHVKLQGKLDAAEQALSHQAKAIEGVTAERDHAVARMDQLRVEVDLALAGLPMVATEKSSIIERVTEVVRDYREALDELAAAAAPEDVADAAARVVGLPTDPPEPTAFMAPRCDGCDETLCRCGKCHTVDVCDASTVHCAGATQPAPLPDFGQIDSLRGIVAAIDSLAPLIAASHIDWTRTPELAWVHGVAIGWHDDDIEMLQGTHGWPDAVAQALRRHRAAVVRAQALVAG